MFDTGNTALPYDYEPPPKSCKPRKWPPVTPALHNEIKRLYQRKEDCSGEVAAFAKRHGLPRWKVTRYAQEKGWCRKQKKEPDWSAGELNILKRHARHHPHHIRMVLKKNGYTRSINGIAIKRKRMRMLQDLGGDSANRLAMCLGIDRGGVIRAIKAGKLKAERRIQERTPQQGGNAWFIREKDIRDYLIENINEIDLAKVDKYWFVDILTAGT